MSRYIYQFKIEDGKYVITGKAEYKYVPDRLLRKVKVKGHRQDYEVVEINNFEAGLYGEYLMERKSIKRSDVELLICSHSNGARSVQWHPYTEDIKDTEIISDKGLTVFTHKHYYPLDDKLLDVYYPIRTDKVNNELLEDLKHMTETAIKEAQEARTRRFKYEKVEFQKV